MEANRTVFGEVLYELAKNDPRIVVVDSDFFKTLNYIPFIKTFPERFFECGIAEQNMFSIAAGLSTCGLIPFAATYAVFASSRGLDQIRNGICYSNLNVKIIGTHGGVETGEDGGTHQAIEDISVMRSLPNMTVVVPSTPNMTRYLSREITYNNGPAYIRFGRGNSPEYYDERESFQLSGSKLLQGGDYATIIACGHMINVAMEAAKILRESGKLVRVIDMYSIKPIDKDAIISAGKETKGIVTVEDHSIIGGLGGAVSEVASEHFPSRVLRIGICDIFGRSGTAQDLFDLYGLTPRKVVEAINSL